MALRAPLLQVAIIWRKKFRDERKHGEMRMTREGTW